MTLGERLWAVLSSPRATLFVVAAGVLLTAPSLTNGLSADDHFQRATVGGYGVIHRAPWDQYRFLSGDPAELDLLTDRGLMPWFSSKRLKTAFFRPLSSLSVFADYAVLPHLPWLFHLESLALYAVLIALVLALYRAVLPNAPLAGLAGLLFAVDDGHGMVVGWLANRNALFAAVFGVGAVVLHHRARARASVAATLLAPLSLALALLSGEAALGAFGYLVAYALAFDPAPARSRLLSFAPYVAVAGAWVFAIRALGCGTAGTGFYVDPTVAPLRFLATFPERWGELFASQFALPAAETWLLAPPAVRVLGGVWCAAVLGVVAWVVWPRLRDDRVARFFAIGTVLALTLATTTIPFDRNLLLAGVGAFGLIALVIGTLATPEARPRPVWPRRVLIGVHLVFAPLLLPGTSVSMGLVDRVARGLLAPFDDPAMASQTVVVVNLPNFLFGAFYWGTPEAPGRPVPARLRALSTTIGPLEVAREDERTVLITEQPGAFRDPTGLVVRDPSERFHEGERFALPGLTVTVIRIDDQGWPLAIRCEFEVPLEDPSLRWLAWTGSSFTDFRPPAIGATVRVPADLTAVP